MLNKYFVVVNITNEDYVDSGSATKSEKEVRDRIMSEVFIKGENNPIRASDAAIYVLDQNGTIIKLGQVEQSIRWSVLKLPDCLIPQKVVDLLEEVRTKQNVVAGGPVVPPCPQSRPPKMNADDIVLHLTARYAPSHGTWKLLPSEDWLVLSKPEWSKLTPRKDAKVGDQWDINEDVAVEILKHFYPPTSNRNPATNQIRNPHLKAKVVSVRDGVMRVRLDSALSMKHRFLPIKDDDLSVEAKVVGYVDTDMATGAIKDVRIVTETGTYANDNFGVSVRLHKADPDDTAAKGMALGTRKKAAPIFMGLGGAVAILGVLFIAARCRRRP